jgi:hypothetical protein
LDIELTLYLFLLLDLYLGGPKIMPKEKADKPDISRIKVNIGFKIPILYFFGSWLVLGIIISVAIYLSSTKDPISRIVDTATFFLLVAGGVLVAVTTYCQWKTVIMGVDQAEYQICMARNKAALDVLRIWDSENMEKERIYYRELREIRGTISNEDLAKLINENPEYRNAILDIANYFEEVYLAIDKCEANEDILSIGLKPLLQSIKKTYDPWFKYLQETDRGYYDQFEPFFKLLEIWDPSRRY